MIGPMKVYPVMEEYWKTGKGYPEPEIGIEIYDIPGNKIIYIMPLVKVQVE